MASTRFFEINSSGFHINSILLEIKSPKGIKIHGMTDQGGLARLLWEGPRSSSIASRTIKPGYQLLIQTVGSSITVQSLQPGLAHYLLIGLQNPLYPLFKVVLAGTVKAIQ
jgi:hypothetical protein